MSPKLLANYLLLISILSLTSQPIRADGPDLGHIQIACEAGVQILLDGTFRAATNADVDGLILQNVKSGRHTLRAVKRGCHPQDVSLEVKGGQVLLVRLLTFRPKIRIVQEGSERQASLRVRHGSLVLQSLPVKCKIDIPDLGLFGMPKAKDRWSAHGVSEGSYSLTATALGRKLTTEVTIAPGRATRLMLDFVSRKVIAHGTSDAPPVRIDQRDDLLGTLEKHVRMRAFFAGPPAALFCHIRNEDVVWFVKRAQNVEGHRITLLSADKRSALFGIDTARFRLSYSKGAASQTWRHPLPAQPLHFANLLDTLLITPEPEPHIVGGRSLGLRLPTIPAKSALYQWGFRTGDVITGLNRQRITSRMEIPELRRALKLTPSVRVTLLRGAKQMSLLFQVRH